MARLRDAGSTQNGPPAATTTRQALKEKTNVTRTKAPAEEVIGDIDKLVKDARPKRGRAKKASQNEDELVMAGGLGPAEPTRQMVLSSELPNTDELAKNDEAPRETAKPYKRPPRMARKPIQNEANSEGMQEMKKRILTKMGKNATATRPAPAKETKAGIKEAGGILTKPSAAHKSGASNVERSEFSLSPSPPPVVQPSSVRHVRPSLGQQQSATKAQTTPNVEHSHLALKNFKRRPRQPSMLAMVQQRTASARPSAVNAQADEDPIVSDDEDFAPDAEGTPLHLTRAKTTTSIGPRPPSESKVASFKAPSLASAGSKRKSEHLEQSALSLDGLKAKRQRSEAPQPERNSDQALLTSIPDAPLPPNTTDAALLKSTSNRASSSARRATPQPHLSSDVQVISSDPSTTPPTEPSSDDGQDGDDDLATPVLVRRSQVTAHPGEGDEFRQESEQDVPSSTMAEPMSSPLQSPRNGRGQPAVLEKPAAQGTRNTKRKQAEVEPKAKRITTATLQSLLPKRRQPLEPRHRKSEYDVESDSEGAPEPEKSDDEDDAAGTSRSRRKTNNATTKSRKSAAPAKATSRKSKARPALRKSAAPTARKPSAPPAKAKQPKKTYGRAGATSDKENEDEANYESLDENDQSVLPDTSISMIEATRSKELEEARKKFAEVDDWDMEFESMSFEEGRSSSQEWR